MHTNVTETLFRYEPKFKIQNLHLILGKLMGIVDLEGTNFGTIPTLLAPPPPPAPSVSAYNCYNCIICSVLSYQDVKLNLIACAYEYLKNKFLSKCLKKLLFIRPNRNVCLYTVNYSSAGLVQCKLYIHIQ